MDTRAWNGDAHEFFLDPLIWTGLQIYFYEFFTFFMDFTMTFSRDYF